MAGHSTENRDAWRRMVAPTVGGTGVPMPLDLEGSLAALVHSTPGDGSITSALRAIARQRITINGVGVDVAYALALATVRLALEPGPRQADALRIAYDRLDGPVRETVEAQGLTITIVRSEARPLAIDITPAPSTEDAPT